MFVLLLHLLSTGFLLYFVTYGTIFSKSNTIPSVVVTGCTKGKKDSAQQSKGRACCSFALEVLWPPKSRFHSVAVRYLEGERKGERWRMCQCVMYNCISTHPAIPLPHLCSPPSLVYILSLECCFLPILMQRREGDDTE